MHLIQRTIGKAHLRRRPKELPIRYSALLIATFNALYLAYGKKTEKWMSEISKYRDSDSGYTSRTRFFHTGCKVAQDHPVDPTNTWIDLDKPYLGDYHPIYEPGDALDTNGKLLKGHSKWVRNEWLKRRKERR